MVDAGGAGNVERSETDAEQTTRTVREVVRTTNEAVTLVKRKSEASQQPVENKRQVKSGRRVSRATKRPMKRPVGVNAGR